MVNRKVFNVVKENLKKRNLGEIVEKHYPNVAVEYTSNNSDERDYRVSGARIQSELGHRCIVTVEEAFLETAKAIENGFFRDPNWIGHSALPLPEFSKLISTQDGK